MNFLACSMLLCGNKNTQQKWLISALNVHQKKHWKSQIKICMSRIIGDIVWIMNHLWFTKSVYVHLSFAPTLQGFSCFFFKLTSFQVLSPSLSSKLHIWLFVEPPLVFAIHLLLVAIVTCLLNWFFCGLKGGAHFITLVIFFVCTSWQLSSCY